MSKFGSFLVLVAGTALAAGPAGAAREGLDQSLDRKTERGLFRVSVQSAEQPIPMNRIHRWTVKLSDAGGRPVADARIAVDGGMPEHGHGLPTAPKAAAAPQPGTYVINGMKFSMDGWWELKLAIEAQGQSDRVTYNIVL